MDAKHLFEWLANTLPGPFRVMMKSLAIRFDRSPLDNVEAIIDFTHTRSSYIAQTALFGYLKTRMGTRFREIFENPEFSRTIQGSAAKIFTACLSDFTIFTVGQAVKTGHLPPIQAAKLANAVYREALRRGLASVDDEMRPFDAVQQFDARVSNVEWSGAALSLDIFEHSAKALIDYAPVIDEFKALDRNIVMNSIRFRWMNVRAQLLERLDSAGIAADWLGPDAAPDAGVNDAYVSR